MEPHARCVVAARIKMCWDLLLVNTVLILLSLELAVPRIPRVSVTMGTRARTDPTARCVVLANTNPILGLLRALFVHLARTWQTTGHGVCCVKTQTRRLRVPALRHVFAMPAGRDRTVSVLRVWLANTNPIRGMFRAMSVQPDKDLKLLPLLVFALNDLE